MDLVEYQAKRQKRHFWELARIKFIKSLLKRYIGKRELLVVADIGSGDCYAISCLMHSFLFRKIYAKDPYLKEPYLSELKTQYPEIIFDTSAGNDLSAISDCDFCFMLDVLEHIENDHEFLVSLNQRLNADGMLLITVPAYNFLFSDHDVFLKHFRRYNRKELCKQLTNASFSIVDSGYFFFSLVLIRFFQKIFHIQDRNEVGNGGVSPLNSFFAWILYLDAEIGYFLNRSGAVLPGLSCWAIARKKNLTGGES